jgi:hypothetical protein
VILRSGARRDEVWYARAMGRASRAGVIAVLLAGTMMAAQADSPPSPRA